MGKQSEIHNYLHFYLDKKLKMQSPHGFIPNGKESTGFPRIVNLTGDLYADIENKTFPGVFIPYLRPMSDLVLPCLDNEKTPFIEIFNLCINNNSQHFMATPDTRYVINDCDYHEHNENNKCILWFDAISNSLNRVERFIFIYNERTQSFHIKDHKAKEINNVCRQFELFNELLKYHFDVFGLLEQTLALNINDIK